ncbi:MAG: arginine--tRNA ligase [Candidatus Woesearchaeota archaeon]
MFKEKIAKLISKKFDLDEKEALSLIEVPPNPSLGDFAFPCFSLAKKLKKSPALIALDSTDFKDEIIKEVKATGPYLNFFLESSFIVDSLKELKLEFNVKKETVLVESPSPNTNKPLHLGHLRNMLLGQSTVKLYEKLGHKVVLTEVVNDKGTHICKSMLAYKLKGEGKTPESEGVKGDFFVGKYYVLFNELKEKDPSMEEKAQEMLVKWEEGDKEVMALWSKMRDWCLEGQRATYKDLDMNIEKTYFESDIYLDGKKIVTEGLKKGIFEKEENGAIFVNLESKGLGKKYLQRKDGTSIYITQDLYLAKKRFEEYSMDRMVYVVGNEQDYHFKVLFEILKLLGYEFADKCFHLSYGMVNLPEGKMKSREGTVVDLDPFRLEIISAAKKEVQSRYEDLSLEEINRRSEIIGNSALRFFILKHDAKKDMVYNPKESLSFSGESGPYVQYTFARICSIFRKSGLEPSLKPKLLSHDLEKQITYKLLNYKEVIENSNSNHKPNLVCNYLLELSQLLTKYYHEVQIINEDKELESSRLYLLDKARFILKDGLEVLGIEVLEEM